MRVRPSALLAALSLGCLPAVLPSPAHATTPTKTYSFEDAKIGGWKAVGTTLVTVTDTTARTGTHSLAATGIGVGRSSGLKWARKLAAFPGTGEWYHVQIPIRPDAEAGVTTGLVWLRVAGASDVSSTAVAVTGGRWNVLEGWFVPVAGLETVTFTVEQAPDVDCAGSAGPVGDVWIDDVTIGREAALPAAAALPRQDGSGTAAAPAPSPTPEPTPEPPATPYAGHAAASPAGVTPLCVS
ncbi:MAG: hypothetical protein U0Q15_03665 [Kineosporiaceae bacterium]